MDKWVNIVVKKDNIEIIKGNKHIVLTSKI